MSVTLTANYKEVLNAFSVEKIDELLEDNYALDDILEFIDTYNERMFVDNYEEYCRCGEVIGYDAVDAYAEENGIDYIEDCDSRYVGEYRSEAEFTEEYYQERHDIPCDLVIDWQATWDSMLRYDFTFCNGYVFSDN